MKDFSRVPSVRYNRSKFDLSHGVKTTMSIGKLYPLKVVEVLPGDTFKSEMTAVSRCTSAFFKPIIDNLYMDVHSFFVPLRLLYDNAERVFGNPNPSAYTDNDLDEFPAFNNQVLEIPSGTVGDYLGLPIDTGKDGKRYVKRGCSVLPFRAFAKIYNDWFRNENTVDEVYIQTGSSTDSETPNNRDWAPNNYTGKLPNVSKKKDYFTSGLPNTQKGSAVPLPLGSYAPVYTGAINPKLSSSVGMRFYSSDSAPSGSIGINVGLDNKGNGDLQLYGKPDSSMNPSGSINLIPSNLYADLSLATASDVATLRTAFQLQKMLEKDARYGSRYNEFLLGHFGVTSPDARLQFSEYLGGGRIPISIQQTYQTSSATETSPLGNVAGQSQTVGRMRYCKGFVEHGYVVTVGCIKQIHTYQQGVPRLFFRHKREDFYDPLLANISEQPVYKAQLFGYADSRIDESKLNSEVFNYNEAWADYRYEPSIVTGQLRSGISNTLDLWHLADYYDTKPIFGQEFTDENSKNIDRVLTVETSVQDNFLVDIWFNVNAIRVMPVYSVPGLVDHH